MADELVKPYSPEVDGSSHPSYEVREDKPSRISYEREDKRRVT
jgi:hypothetical protein